QHMRRRGACIRTTCDSMKPVDTFSPTFEQLSVEDLGDVFGGQAASPAPEKPDWKEIAQALSDLLDRAIEARPFEKICNETRTCYEPPRREKKQKNVARHRQS